MANEKFMMVSLEDPKMKSLSDVLGNKTCKKIIDYLAENEEASQKDLTDALGIPINTIEYNIKKLVLSGLVQKRKNFFWSKKGKKIIMYELSNKSIVISPRKSMGEKLMKLLPAVMVTGALTFGTFVYDKVKYAKQITFDGATNYALQDTPTLMNKAMDTMTLSVANSQLGAGASDGVARVTMDYVANTAMQTPSETWMWFLAGGLIALFVYSLVNWKRL